MEGEFLDYLDEERALCVRSSYTQSDKPIRVTLWWPIWRGSRQNAECYALGHKLSGRDGRYGYDWYGVDIHGMKPTLPESARRTIFLLENGGRTEAIKVLQEEVPQPKVRAGVEVKWQGGRWRKWLKSKGWVDA